GFGGDNTTWKNDATGNDWLTLLTSDPELANDIDVYRVNYFTPHVSDLGSIAALSVPQISEVLAKKLDDLLFEEGKYKKVVLICHSLGGILCRSHLLHVKLRWGHTYLSLFPASFTFGTPLLGTAIANFVSLNIQARALTPAEGNQYLQLLM